MANNYEQIMALVNAGNKMGLSNTITRDNGIPLDLSSIYETYEDAVIYAATKAIAYQDQIIAAEGVAYIIVAESQGQVTINETVYENYLKPIGTIPGFDDAQDGTVAIKQDGSLVWKTLEEIGAGDGNDNTTYTFEGLTNEANEVYGIKIQAYFNGVAQGDAVEIALTAYTKAEADKKFALKGEDAYDDTALSERVKAIEDDYLKAEDKYDDTALAARVAENETAIGVLNGNSSVEGSVDKKVADALNAFATEISDDGTINTFKELIDYAAAHGSDFTELVGEVDANTAALVTLNGTVETEGSIAKQIADAIAPLATTESVNTGLAAKADKTALADYYTKTEADGKYALIETAATKTELEAVSTVANNAATKVETLEDKIDEIIADGGEPNVIEYIKVNGTILEVETDEAGDSTKTVNIEVPTEIADLTDGAALKGTVASNTTLAQKGVDDAATAKSVADAAAAQAEQNKTDLAGHLARIGALETAKSSHETRVASLEGIVGHGASEGVEASGLVKSVADNAAAIGALQGNINALAAEDGRLAGLINTNTTEIAKKANAADVYTKAEADSAISSAIAEIPAVDLSAYLKSADADTTYAKIASVEAIYKAGEGEAAATGLLAEEIARAKAAEEKNAADIALLLDNPDTEAIDSIKELLAYYEEHGEVLTQVDTRLDGHDALLAGIGGEGEPATVMAAIQASAYTLPAATTDTLGGIKASTSIAVAEDGTAAVAQVSTDLLVQGVDELILCGGTATGASV